jgi:DNA recombination protein RmuC
MLFVIGLCVGRVLGIVLAGIVVRRVVPAGAPLEPVARGQWGELTLHRVIELAGMAEHVDYDEQAVLAGDEGKRLRPDLIVRIPGGRSIAVDAKAPVEARALRAHAMKLGARGYWRALSPAPELVVLFLPAESLFAAACAADPGLVEAAARERVVIATPSTLIALLRTCAFGWRQDRAAAHGRELAELGEELHDRLRGLGAHFLAMKKGLDGAVDAFNRATGTFETRVLPSARRLQEAGAAGDEPIEPPGPVDRATRALADGLR